MMTESRFDPVFDCQEVFKALMNAFAQPGKVFSIEKNVEKLEGRCASLTAAAMVLLDNWRSFYVEGDAALEEELREQTYGVPAAMDEADYLFSPVREIPGRRWPRQSQALFQSLTKAPLCLCWPIPWREELPFLSQAPAWTVKFPSHCQSDTGPGWRLGTPRGMNFPAGWTCIFSLPRARLWESPAR